MRIEGETSANAAHICGELAQPWTVVQLRCKIGEIAIEDADIMFLCQTLHRDDGVPVVL